MSNIFSAPHNPDRITLDNDAPPIPATPPSYGPYPWLYFNALLAESEVFIPVFDVRLAEELATKMWEGRRDDGGSGHAHNGFQRVADLAIAAMLLDSTRADGALPLEDRGLTLGARLARFAYAAGGDGEQVIKTDLREFVSFVRDPKARVNCIVQPFSCSAEIDTRVPEVAEVGQAEKLHRAACVIQRQWRVYLEKKKLRWVYMPCIISLCSIWLWWHSILTEFSHVSIAGLLLRRAP